MTAAELCSRAGVSMQTAATKARAIERGLKIEPLDPRWCVPSVMEKNPLAWMIVVDGFMIDARVAPREIQEVAFRKGLIPFMPEPLAGAAPDSAQDEMVPGEDHRTT